MEALKASIAGAARGMGDGWDMVANAITLGQNDFANDRVQEMIAREGGMYAAANYAAQAGAIAAWAAASLGAAAGLAAMEGATLATFTFTSGGLAGISGGVATVATSTVTVTTVVQAGAITTATAAVAATAVYMTGEPPDDLMDEFWNRRLGRDYAEESLSREEARAQELLEQEEYEAYDFVAQRIAEQRERIRAMNNGISRVIDQILDAMGL